MELIVITKTKNTIYYIDNILTNFPRKENVLKDKLQLILYDLLETIYYSNYLSKEERINNLYLCLTKIKMLDFYLKQCMDKKIISYKKFINICSYLNDITKMIYGWINNEKSK